MQSELQLNPPSAISPPNPARARRSVPRLQELGLIGVIFVIGLVLSIYGRIDAHGGPNTFLNLDNLIGQIATYMAVYAIMAVGVTFVIITGGIDISVGSIFALSAMGCAGVLQNLDPESSPFKVTAIAFIVGPGIGLLCGLFNGILITSLRLHPFIVTLGTLSIYRGIANIATDIKTLPAPGKDIPAGFTEHFMQKYFFESVDASGSATGGVQLMPMIVMLVVLAFGWFYLRMTVAGRENYAIGGNEEAARFSGIRVNMVKLRVYALSGLTAGIAGAVSLGWFSTASANTGTGYELMVIAAAVVGGASLTGGRGTALGAILGALIIRMIENGIFKLHLKQEYNLIIVGSAIIIAVSIDRVSEYLRARRLARQGITEARRPANRWRAGLDFLRCGDSNRPRVIQGDGKPRHVQRVPQRRNDYEDSWSDHRVVVRRRVCRRHRVVRRSGRRAGEEEDRDRHGRQEPVERGVPGRLYGALDAAKELGDKYNADISINWQTPPDEDAQKQVQAVEALSGSGVQGLAVSCSEARTLTTAIDKAVRKGIPVICFDSDAPKSKRFAYYGTDDEACGKSVMLNLAKAMGDKGTVAILAGNQSAPNLQNRVKGVKEELASHPGMKLLEASGGVFYHQETPEKAAEAVQSAQNANPGIEGWAFIGGWPLFTANALPWPPGKVKVVSVDALPAQLPYLKDGHVELLLAQDCYGWGHKSVEILLEKIVNKKNPEPARVVDPLTPVTKDTADEFGKNWEKWLKK